MQPAQFVSLEVSVETDVREKAAKLVVMYDVASATAFVDPCSLVKKYKVKLAMSTKAVRTLMLNFEVAFGKLFTQALCDYFAGS